jgi:hypothetical protein
MMHSVGADPLCSSGFESRQGIRTDPSKPIHAFDSGLGCPAAIGRDPNIADYWLFTMTYEDFGEP